MKMKLEFTHKDGNIKNQLPVLDIKDMKEELLETMRRLNNVLGLKDTQVIQIVLTEPVKEYVLTIY